MEARQRWLSEGVAGPYLLLDVRPLVFLDILETREAVLVPSLAGDGQIRNNMASKRRGAYVAVKECFSLISATTSFHVLFCEMNRSRICASCVSQSRDAPSSSEAI